MIRMRLGPPPSTGDGTAGGGELLVGMTATSATLADGTFSMDTPPLTDANHELCIVATGVVLIFVAAAVAASLPVKSSSASTLMLAAVTVRVTREALGNVAIRELRNPSRSKLPTSPARVNAVETRWTYTVPGDAGGSAGARPVVCVVTIATLGAVTTGARRTREALAASPRACWRLAETASGWTSSTEKSSETEPPVSVRVTSDKGTPAAVAKAAFIGSRRPVML